MATILKVPTILLPSPRLRSYSPENPKSIVNFSSFKQRFSGPFQFSLSYLPSKRTFLPGKFAPFASSGETTGTQEIDEEVKAEEYSEEGEEEVVEDEASIDENAPGEGTTASAVLAALQSYKQALANNDQSTIAEIESFLQSIEDEKNSLANKLNALSADMATERDRVLRISADFDNFRKRTERERLSLLSNAQGEVLESLLPVLDNFERAKSQIKVETEGEEKINNSYQSIYKQFLELLNSLGVKAVETVGTAFDPLLHEAIMREESTEYDEGVIIQEFRKGFKLGDRLLRPAMVKVSAGPGPAKSIEEDTVIPVASEENEEADNDGADD